MGQEVEIQPSGLRTRIRNLQTHKHKVETAQPGSRVAVNLTGVSTDEIGRGDVVTTSRWLQPTRAVDVAVKVLVDAKPLAHGATVSFHTGSAEVEARVSLLDAEAIESGRTGWAQLRLAGPVAVVKGDFFVVRTPNATVGGGEIVDAHPHRHRRFQETTIESLSTMQRGGPEDLLLQAFDKPVPQEVDAAARQIGLSAEVARAAAAQLVAQGAALGLGGFFMAAAAWRQAGRTGRGDAQQLPRAVSSTPGYPQRGAEEPVESAREAIWGRARSVGARWGRSRRRCYRAA